ncbi:MAG: Immunoglobulin I-set domain protein [Pedosphaera sp.]|nr:Immunoglobulin I-set domain protein [Pedosphaera sp.]
MIPKFLLLFLFCTGLAASSAFAQTSPWSQIANFPGSPSVRHDDIYFTDTTNGWCSQNNNVYRTTNGGVTWTTSLTVAGTHFRSVTFANPKVGFAGNLGVGSYDGNVSNTNVMYRSFDGGLTWSNVPGFAEAGMKGLCAMFVLDSQHVYGAGRVRGPAFVIRSTDGGTNWNMVNLTAMGVMNGIMDIYFKDPLNGWVVGMDTNQYSASGNPPYHGRIAKTTDGGNTWTPVVTTTISNCYFWKISWPSTNVGYVALQQNGAYSSFVFYKTVDGGNNWVSNGIPVSSVGRSDFYLQGLAFVTPDEGWIGGASSSTPPYSSTFLHTTDGGVTWSAAGYSDTRYINRIRFLSPNLGYASGWAMHRYVNPLVITNQPGNQTVIGGTNITLAVGASGNTPITYQWKKNGTNQPGATSPTLTLNNVTRLDSGAYSVVLTNTGANLQSSNALIHIMVADRLDSPVLLPGGQLRLLMNDADGGAFLTTNDIPHFEVLISTNLINWTVITNALSITNGSLLMEDAFTNSANRYYRLLEK